MPKPNIQVRLDENTMRILAAVKEYHGICYSTAAKMAIMEKFGSVLEMKNQN